MEMAILFFGILCLLFLVGSILGWVAFLRVDKLSQENGRIHRELIELSTKLNRYIAKASEPQVNNTFQTAPEQEKTDDKAVFSESIVSEPKVSESIVSPDTVSSINTAPLNQASINTETHPLIDNIKANWMIWIGGISIGLAGVFFVKYSIDNGLLGPTARIVLAFLTGVLFHVAAYYLHIKKGQNDIFAALAGGASLILYSACLAALHLYQLFSPGWAFIILSIVSLATMLLALVQGPVLAALGILGAYLVPIFVSTGSNNVSAALIYSFIVSCSALLLIRFVKRDWLWIGTLVGAGFWWLISLTVVSTEVSRLLYLLALAYAVLAIECWDWRLFKVLADKPSSANQSLFELLKQSVLGSQQKIVIAMMVLLLSWCISAALAPVVFSVAIIFTLFVVATLYAAYQQRALIYLGWLGFAAMAAGLLLQGIDINSPRIISTLSFESDKLLLTLIIILGAVYAGGSFLAFRVSEYKGYWSSLGLLAPLILIALAYVRVESIKADWYWASLALGLGVVYFHLLYRQKSQLSPAVIVAIIFSGHLAYSLAVVILCESATLTLALAVQVVSLSWLDRYFRLSILPVLIKIILAVVIARLTLNPWLLTYPADIHWSLWTYGGSFLCCVLAAYFIQKHEAIDNTGQHQNRDQLLRWIKAAGAHLLVLTIIAETRYQLYDGNIFVQQYSFFEAAINTSVLGALGVVYLIRAQVAATFERVYHWIASILLFAAFGNYLVCLLLVKNPLFTGIEISSTPIANILLLAYGLPCIIGLLVMYFYRQSTVRRIVGGIVALMLLIFVSLEIRHLWHGTLDISQPILVGEIYTYSMAWLLMAIAGSLIGIKLKNQDCYRGSMLFLLIVVAKIFLVDTSGLSSLWRVGAFMGLGIALLGLAYLHQKMRVMTDEEDELVSPEITP